MGGGSGLGLSGGQGGGIGSTIGGMAGMMGGPMGSMAGSAIGGIADAAMGGGEGPSSATSGFTGDLSNEQTFNFASRTNGIDNTTLMVGAGIVAGAVVLLALIKR